LLPRKRQIQTKPDEHRAEADYQTDRALNLAPDNEEVKKLHAEVIELRNLSSLQEKKN